jgi:glycosyltransferase involved in cell wall biosynthesis
MTPLVVVSTALNATEWVGRCLESVATQTLKVPHHYVTDGEDTLAVGQRFAKEHGFELANVRRGPGPTCVHNLIEAVKDVPPETAVAWLDGDDWFARPDALEIVARAYEDPNVWVTFGQFRWWPQGTPGFAKSYPPEVVAANGFRNYAWLATILRTFRAGLFQQLDYEELKQSNGTCVDQLIMLALLELAGERHKFIPEILVEYNSGNFVHMPEDVKDRENQELVRVRRLPPLKRLAACPWRSEPDTIPAPRPQQSLCLNMIVKDEEAIIRRCLESCKPYISSWCIVDTGSTDRTREIVREVLADIPGELHERPWVNFGHNRTEAFELAKPLADWVLLMDADHMVDETSEFPELGVDGGDNYYLPIENWSEVYKIVRIIRADQPWYFDGATHEAIRCALPTKARLLSSVTLSEYADSVRRSSHRKGAEDLVLLEEQYARNPNDTRTVFYLAQSYFDDRKFDQAFEFYAKRTQMGGYQEEVFWSLFRIGLIHQSKGPAHWSKAMSAFLSAYECRPTRAEPLILIASHYNDIRHHDIARLFAQQALAMKVHPADCMFVNHDCHGGDLAKEEFARSMQGMKLRQQMAQQAHQQAEQQAEAAE